jgi:hypothetical protein
LNGAPNPAVQGTLRVSEMKPQLGNQECISFSTINHAMFFCYAARPKA